MIKIMKKYENPMLQVVSISKKDVIATSVDSHDKEGYGEFAPGQRGVFDWDAGY